MTEITDLSEPKVVEHVLCGDEWLQPGSTSGKKQSVRIVARRQPEETEFTYYTEIETVLESRPSKNANGDPIEVPTKTEWNTFNPTIRMLEKQRCLLPALYQAGAVKGREAAIESERKRVDGLIGDLLIEIGDMSEPLAAALKKFRDDVAAGTKPIPAAENGAVWDRSEQPG